MTNDNSPRRWKAVALYRTDAGFVDVEHFFEEIEELHDHAQPRRRGREPDCREGGAAMTSPIPDRFMEKARELRQSVLWTSNSSIERIARELAAAEREGMKRAAEIALTEGDKTEPAVGYVISQRILDEAGKGE